MEYPFSSAAYFGRNKDVDDFLEQFVIIRKYYLNSHPCSSSNSNDSSVPNDVIYRNSTVANVDNNKSALDVTSNDNLIQVANKMGNADSIHLEAFISLVRFITVICNDIAVK